MGPLARWLPAAGLAARARGTRVSLAGIGVYRSTPPLVLRMLARLARTAQACSVRDEASRVVLAERSAWSTVIADLSRSMPLAPVGRGAELLEAAGLDPYAPTVGLCLTAAEPALGRSLADVVPALVARHPDVQFSFVPMSRHPAVARQDDLRLGRRLRHLEPRIALVEGWHHPADIQSLFGKFRAVVAMRYHSLLFAERVGVPLVPISYAEKCDDWLLTRTVTGASLELAALDRRLSGALGPSQPAPRSPDAVL